MIAYLYVIQPADMPLWKLGHTCWLDTRIQGLQGQSPHRMRFVRILALESKYHASAFERYVLSWLKPHRSHGEWINNLDAIHEQLDAVCPAVDVTDEYTRDYKNRTQFARPYSAARLEKSLREADKRLQWDESYYKKQSRNLSVGVSVDVSQLDVLAGDQRGGADSGVQGGGAA